MFEDKFLGFGGFHGDFNIRRRDFDRPHLGSGGFLQNHCYDKLNTKKSDTLDLCKKLSKMGISCDMSIWTKPDPRATLHGFEQNLPGGASGFLDVSSDFLQKSSHGAFRGGDGGELRLLGFQDSQYPNNHRGFLLDQDLMDRPIKRLSPCFRQRDDALMFEGNRVSQALNAMDVSGAFYPADTFRRVDALVKGSLMFEGNRVSQALAAIEASSTEDGLNLIVPKSTSGFPLSLASMVNIYGSVSLMAKDQIGCRVLQKLVDEGTFLDSKIILLEIINHVVEISMDPFGNYIVQKLLEHVREEEQRTLIVSVLTSKPVELIKLCLNTYGTRVVQKMIETVKTKQQIWMVTSGLKHGFLALVKDLNGNHVIQTCLNSLAPNDNKFVLEAATKYCAEIATHRHGCCVLQCCISNSVGAQHDRLVHELSRNALHLSQDPFGNYVVQYLIEQNVSAAKLLNQFRTHYAELATQKFSSHVVEKCLRKYPQSRAAIVHELLSFSNFEHLLQDPFGNYVIQTALSVTKGYVRAALVEKVHRYGKLKSSPYCKKIFSKTILKK